jgi:putative tryptophan/tyrosine transport system substrate-binding protein
VGDPVASGLLTNIARPEANIIGLANITRDTYIKRVAILKELVPSLSKLALIAHLDTPVQVEQERAFYEAGATANGIQLQVFPARDKPSIDEAFEKLSQAGCHAVMISQQPLFFLFREELANAALKHRLPSMGPSDAFVPVGVLVAYAPLIRQRFRELSALAARILRGAKPGELPVQFPTVFEFAINMKTATQLGLTVPQTVLASATRVVE